MCEIIWHFLTNQFGAWIRYVPLGNMPTSFSRSGNDKRLVLTYDTCNHHTPRFSYKATKRLHGCSKPEQQVCYRSANRPQATTHPTRQRLPTLTSSPSALVQISHGVRANSKKPCLSLRRLALSIKKLSCTPESTAPSRGSRNRAWRRRRAFSGLGCSGPWSISIERCSNSRPLFARAAAKCRVLHGA